MKLYQVVGRKAPTPTDPNPSAYRMKLFAANEVLARSRFWYFMHQMRKMKKTTGEILDVNEITEKNTRYVKNYGFWLKYNSRSGIHNMYREYRDTSLTAAIDTLYNDMAGRHRSRNRSIQVIRTAVVAPKDCKRDSTIQFHDSKLKFPLPHRLMRPSSKALRSTFSAMNTNTHFN
ncbi:unnamed protein product [Ectocarpus fasciculatus]